MRRTGTERYLIDSTGWIEYLTESKLAGKYARHIESCKPDRNITPSIVIYEVYKKMMTLWSEEEVITAIAHIDNYTTVVDIDIRAAVKGAETSLEEKLPMADALIYGIATMHGAKLVTSDSHFKGMENVIFIK